MPTLIDHLSAVLNRRVAWTDKKGVSHTGILREIRRQHLIVDKDAFGLTNSRPAKVEFDCASLIAPSETPPEAYVTHTLVKESGYFWRWEIMIDGSLWRKRRGFRSYRTATNSLQANLLEAADAARNLHPSASAIAATFLYSAEFETSHLGPADFFDGLPDSKRNQCDTLIELLNR